MSFPITPIFYQFLVNMIPSLVIVDIVLSGIVVAVGVILWIWIWGRNAIRRSYASEDTMIGIVCLLIAVVFAVLGMTNIVFTFVIGVFLYLIAEYFVWKFLIRFLFWRLLVKNILVVFSERYE